MSTAQTLPAVPEDPKALERFSGDTSLLEMKVGELVVVDQASLDRAAVLLKGIKALGKAITDWCDPSVKKANELHKMLTAQRRMALEPVEDAEREVKKKIVAYTNEQERIAREAAALEEEARRKETAKAEQDATELEAAGEHALADSVREDADEANVPAPVAAAPKARGVVMRDNWKAEVTDPMALVKAIAAGQVPIAVIKFDTKVLSQQARSLRKELNWPGVRVWNDKGAAVR